MRKLAYLAAVALLCTGIVAAQSTSTSDQNTNSSTSAQQSTTDQNQAAPATTPSTNTSDQSSTSNSAAASGTQTGQNATRSKKLPQTASPLPFLSLLGMGMLGAGGLGRVRNFFRK